MQQIADAVGVHVTTISRAVDDKWIQNSRGIFPLKRFFVGGTRSEDGEDVAWDTIRIKLNELIEKEDKQKPYSDDDLVGRVGQDRTNRGSSHNYQVSQEDGHFPAVDNAKIGRRSNIFSRVEQVNEPSANSRASHLLTRYHAPVRLTNISAERGQQKLEAGCAHD